VWRDCLLSNKNTNAATFVIPSPCTGEKTHRVRTETIASIFSVAFNRMLPGLGVVAPGPAEYTASFGLFMRGKNDAPTIKVEGMTDLTIQSWLIACVRQFQTTATGTKWRQERSGDSPLFLRELLQPLRRKLPTMPVAGGPSKWHRHTKRD
jgi:hypothetical protein